MPAASRGACCWISSLTGQRVFALIKSSWSSTGRAENTHAGWRFCLIGQSNIRIGAPQSAEEWSDQKLAKVAREHLSQGDNPEALLTLIKRITLRCYQESGTLEAAEHYMRDSGNSAIP